MPLHKPLPFFLYLSISNLLFSIFYLFFFLHFVFLTWCFLQKCSPFIMFSTRFFVGIADIILVVQIQLRFLVVQIAYYPSPEESCCLFFSIFSFSFFVYCLSERCLFYASVRASVSSNSLPFIKLGMF